MFFQYTSSLNAKGTKIGSQKFAKQTTSILSESSPKNAPKQSAKRRLGGDEEGAGGRGNFFGSEREMTPLFSLAIDSPKLLLNDTDNGACFSKVQLVLPMGILIHCCIGVLRSVSLVEKKAVINMWMKGTADAQLLSSLTHITVLSFTVYLLCPSYSSVIIFFLL